MNLNSADLILLTSPPASGKTYWIRSLMEVLKPEGILIISPLRALADECKLKWGNECFVVTPEEWSAKKIFKEVVIFDEFHLNFYWGDSFRPIMWEVFFELSLEARLTVLLTATLSSEMRTEISHFNSQFNQIFWCNHGNQILKFSPTRYFKVPGRKWLADYLLTQPQGMKTSLLFCAYRGEVLTWGERLRKEGFTVWTCIGGEASAFSKRVQKEDPPDFIVATTVLSHGVNLPRLTSIYFLYEVKNLDFWIQMVARGGRHGESYQVFALESPSGIKWNRWINDLAILILSFKIKMHKLKRQRQQWFLKELSSTKSPIRKEISS